MNYRFRYSTKQLARLEDARRTCRQLRPLVFCDSNAAAIARRCPRTPNRAAKKGWRERAGPSRSPWRMVLGCAAARLCQLQIANRGSRLSANRKTNDARSSFVHLTFCFLPNASKYRCLGRDGADVAERETARSQLTDINYQSETCGASGIQCSVADAAVIDTQRRCICGRCPLPDAARDATIRGWTAQLLLLTPPWRGVAWLRGTAPACLSSVSVRRAITIAASVNFVLQTLHRTTLLSSLI